MIKTQHSIDTLNALALDFYEEIKQHLKIEALIKNRNLDELSPVFKYIEKELKNIIIGHPKEFKNHIDKISKLEKKAKQTHISINPNKTISSVNTWYKNEILKIFNYDTDHNSFTKHNDGEYAYKHAIKLQINTCPYCNSQFTYTMQKNSKIKTRPHFDHFYCKKKYPYLALSFFNLIPSCYICNSSLKGQKLFSYETHIHPYVDSMEDLFKFRTNIQSVEFLTGIKQFEIALEPQKTGNKSDIARAAKNLEVFAIKERYQNHKDIAGEIISKSHIYNKSTIKELLNDYEIAPGKKLFSNEKEIIELFLGNYLYQDKLHKRILSKLTKDIAEEFGLKF